MLEIDNYKPINCNGFKPSSSTLFMVEPIGMIIFKD